MPAPAMGPPSGPNSGPPNQQVVIQQSPSATPTTPVQVTQSGSQVQVILLIFPFLVLLSVISIAIVIEFPFVNFYLIL